MIMKSFIILFCVFVAVHATGLTHRDVFESEWAEFKARFEKIYEDVREESFRAKIFMENKFKIAKHNQLANKGHKSYLLAMNEFGDRLHHEFITTMNGYRGDSPKTANGSSFLVPSNLALPKNVDWRQEGYVTPVKNQKQCGSCWSFSATGALEGQNYRKTGRLISLSEQNLMDCSKSYGNNGCEGGLMDNAFQYIKENRGIDTEDSYPYLAVDESCHFKRYDVGARDSGYVDIPEGDERKLQAAVASVGPVSVAIDASHESFQFYSRGVYDEPECSSDQLDHGVLVVGYGEQSSEAHGKQKYWIVKNSWGESWGEGGFIKMSRDVDNQCGIASSASYPLV